MLPELYQEREGGRTEYGSHTPYRTSRKEAISSESHNEDAPRDKHNRRHSKGNSKSRNCRQESTSEEVNLTVLVFLVLEDWRY